MNSKILVHSYAFNDFNIIVDKVNYLKYLKINHGVRFFKKDIGNYELQDINKTKFNTIITSPLEYEIYKNTYNLSELFILLSTHITLNIFTNTLNDFIIFIKFHKNKK